MSVLILTVDEVMRTLTNDGQYPFVVNDKTVDIVRFAMNTGFTDIALDEHSALRVMYQRPGETEVRAQTLTYHDTDGLRNFYDWQLLSADLAEKGTLTVALCILRVADGDVEEWHTTPYQIRVLDTIHTDDSDEGDESITPTVAQRVAVLESITHGLVGGAPIVVGSVSEMDDTDRIYVLTTDGKWYWYDGTAWVEGGTYGAAVTDTTLSVAGAPADAKKVGDILEAVKFALLDCFMNVAWINDDGQSYYDALEAAFDNESHTLLSITAIFTQGSNIIYDTDTLDSLKEYLIVTANYDDSSSKAITGYILSGTLTIGTSTITVSYGGKTTTFNVVVSGKSVVYKLSDETLSPLVKGTMTTVDNRPCILQEGAGQVINVLTGDVPFLIKETVSSTATESIYYPIPIPSYATRVTVSVLPNTLQINANIRKYENGAFTIIVTGDKTASVQYDFSASENLYVVGRVQNDVDASSVTDVIIECE